ILEPIPSLENEKFDIVVADPPAFIKNRKDLPIGKHAYLKINTQAIKWLESSGILVTCSCSGLLTEEDLLEVLAKAARRSGRDLQNLVRGGHGPDHPTLPGFPEGKYLKMILSRA